MTYKKSISLALSFIILIGLLVAPVSASASGGGGSFRVSGSKIYRPDGTEFIIKGINVNGPGYTYKRDTLQDVGLLVDTWQFNAVRLCAAEKWNWFASGWNRDLDAIIKAFTSRGIVVILSNHDYTGTYPSLTAAGGWDKESNYLYPLSNLKTWWIDKAHRFKDNPYVWFNIMSEPGANANQTSIDLWRRVHSEVIEDIRAAGARNIIVLDEHAKGQGNGYRSGSSSNDSAVMSAGAELNRKYGNLVFSLHVYEAWADGYTRMDRYFRDARERGLSVIIGGYSVAKGDARQKNAVSNMFNAAIPNGVGRMYREWDDYNLPMTTSGHGWQINRADGVKPDNLTWVGDLIWQDNRGQLAAPIESGAAGGSLIDNGGFERVMSDWEDWGRVSVVSGASYNSSKALKVWPGGAGGASLAVKMKPNTIYRLSAYGKNDRVASPATTIGIKYKTSASSPYEQHHTINFHEDGWMWKSTIFNTPTQLYDAQFYIWKADEKATFLIDDIELIEEIGSTRRSGQSSIPVVSASSAAKTPAPSQAVTPTPKPQQAQAQTQAPARTPSPAPKPTATPSPAPKVTATPKPTQAPATAPKATATPSRTPSPAPKQTRTPSPAPKQTAAPKPTATRTPTPAPAQKPTATRTPTPAPKPTATRTPSPAPKPIATPSRTPSPAPKQTAAPKPTATQKPAPTPSEEDITARFTDPNFLAAVRAIVKKPTGSIFKSDVANIQNLNVNNKKISTLAGIEFFTALETLNCSGNNLGKLDMSKNPALTTLDCQNNRLTDIIVSKNDVLNALNCSFNLLEKLDVSRNGALTHLDCSNNQLQYLSVVNNKKLQKLECRSNRLSKLDVSKNGALNWLDVRYNYFNSINEINGWRSVANSSFSPQNI